MTLLKIINFTFILFIGFMAWAQLNPSAIPASPTSSEPILDDEVPNSKRIRRQINLIIGVEHDEEFLIPDKDVTIGGRTEFFDIRRIKDTDYFRIFPKRAGSGITTLKDKKTGQILVPNIG